MKKLLTMLISIAALAVSTLAQYSDRTPNVAAGPSPTPAGYGWEYDVPRFLGIPGLVWGILGVALVLGLLFWKFGFRNPFAKKKPNPYLHVDQ